MAIKNITVGFSTTNKLISRFIRWVSGAPCSHAWVCFTIIDLDLRVVMQSEAWGYEIRPRARWDIENILVAEYTPIINPNDLIPALKSAISLLGTDYDFGSAIRTGLRNWFNRWFQTKLSFNVTQSPKRLMCSESVIRILKQAECEAIAELDIELTSPGRLLETISRSNEFVKVKI